MEQLGIRVEGEEVRMLSNNIKVQYLCLIY